MGNVIMPLIAACRHFRSQAKINELEQNVAVHNYFGVQEKITVLSISDYMRRLL